MPKLSKRKPVRTYDDLEAYRKSPKLKPGQAVKDHGVPNLAYEKQGDRMFARLRVRGKNPVKKSWPMPTLQELWTEAEAAGKAIPKSVGCVAADEHLEKVRREARQLRLQSKLGLTAAAPEAPSVKRIVADLVAHYRRTSEGHLKPRTYRDEGNYLKREELKPLLGRELDSITTADMLELHTSLSRAPYVANRMLDLLRVIFNHGITLGWLTANPTKRVRRFKEAPRRVFLKPDQLERLMEELYRDPHPLSVHSRNAVLLMALTGARPGEVLGATWDEFDVEAKLWTKPASKTKQKEDHVFPLEGPALELVRTLPRTEGTPYVFPSPVEPGKHLRDPGRLWKRATEAAGLEGFRIYDLRKTFGSLLAQDGESIYLISKLLGHSNIKTTVKRYAHHQTDALRGAAAGYAKRFARAEH